MSFTIVSIAPKLTGFKVASMSFETDNVGNCSAMPVCELAKEVGKKSSVPGSRRTMQAPTIRKRNQWHERGCG